MIFFFFLWLLKAFKTAAESLEKLMDVTREELPDTMAAVRLSGMEISDLTMELSDLGLVLVFSILKLEALIKALDTLNYASHFFWDIVNWIELWPPIICYSYRQEITQGVRSSTRAVRVAEERLRQLTNITPTGRLHYYLAVLWFLAQVVGFGAMSFTPSLLV